MGRRSIAGTIMLAALGTCVSPAIEAAPPAASAATPAPAPSARPAGDFVFDRALVQGAAVTGIAPAGTVSLSFNGADVPLAPDGRFMIAFDRDAAAEAVIAATLKNGSVISTTLAVAPRAWKIENVNTPLRPSVPNETYLALRKPELEAIAAARAQHNDSVGWRQKFTWPRQGRISGLFGSQRIYQGQPGSYHSGVDVTGATGEPVRAPADGVVILAADHPFTLEGNLLMIDHGMGLNSAFLHLSRIDVKVGDHVRQGQLVGAVGSTGRATGPHLHWSMKWNDARIDPLLLAGPMPGG